MSALVVLSPTWCAREGSPQKKSAIVRTPGHPGPLQSVCSVPMEPVPTLPIWSPALRWGRNGLVFAVAVLSTSCVTEFPERLEATGDALTPAGDATGVVPGADASVSLDGTPTPDAVSPPTTPPVPDAGPPDPVPDAEVAAVERCNGGDDDGDGLVDEDGDADCRARHRDERPLCRGGRCLTCVVETNEGCPASLACRRTTTRTSAHSAPRMTTTAPSIGRTAARLRGSAGRARSWRPTGTTSSPNGAAPVHTGASASSSLRRRPVRSTRAAISALRSACIAKRRTSSKPTRRGNGRRDPLSLRTGSRV
jgi:hypothetical protein